MATVTTSGTSTEASKFSAHNTADHSIVSPTTWTLLRTSYVPQQSTVWVDVDVDLTILEWQGSW